MRFQRLVALAERLRTRSDLDTLAAEVGTLTHEDVPGATIAGLHAIILALMRCYAATVGHKDPSGTTQHWAGNNGCWHSLVSVSATHLMWFLEAVDARENEVGLRPKHSLHSHAAGVEPELIAFLNNEQIPTKLKISVLQNVCRHAHNIACLQSALDHMHSAPADCTALEAAAQVLNVASGLSRLMHSAPELLLAIGPRSLKKLEQLLEKVEQGYRTDVKAFLRGREDPGSSGRRVVILDPQLVISCLTITAIANFLDYVQNERGDPESAKLDRQEFVRVLTHVEPCPVHTDGAGIDDLVDYYVPRYGDEAYPASVPQVEDVVRRLIISALSIGVKPETWLAAAQRTWIEMPFERTTVAFRVPDSNVFPRIRPHDTFSFIGGMGRAPLLTWLMMPATLDDGSWSGCFVDSSYATVPHAISANVDSVERLLRLRGMVHLLRAGAAASVGTAATLVLVDMFFPSAPEVPSAILGAFLGTLAVELAALRNAEEFQGPEF